MPGAWRSDQGMLTTCRAPYEVEEGLPWSILKSIAKVFAIARPEVWALESPMEAVITIVSPVSPSARTRTTSLSAIPWTRGPRLHTSVDPSLLMPDGGTSSGS